MRAQALTCEITIDRVDLEALDKVLRSDGLPPNGMMVSELDGFLTGIAIGPELIRPSEWLPLVWGGNTPEFAGLDEANAVLGSLMVRYNEILRDVADDAFAPIFWTDRKGTVVATDWAEGFLQAIKLRPDAWKPLFTSERDGKLLFPILINLPTRISSSNGFMMYSCAPLVIASSIADISVSVVQNTTGGFSGPYSARSCLRKSNPFITGMFQSSRTQSGICARQASSAC